MEKLENFWHNLFKKKDKKSLDKTDRVIKDDLKSDNNVISDGENKENVVSYDNKQKENLINTGMYLLTTLYVNKRRYIKNIFFNFYHKKRLTP